MNEKLLKNILLYQDDIEPLDTNLFNNFISSVKNFYYFVSSTDMFVEKAETVEEIKKNKTYLETLENINALNRLGVHRDTKYKLLKYILEDMSNSSEKILHTMVFTIYLFRPQKIKFLKQQQMELIDIIKQDRDMENTNVAHSLIELFLGLDVIKEKYFLENKTIGKFDLYHNLNKSEKFKFGDMKDQVFINYIVKQFATYRLTKPMSLVKNDTSLKEAVLPFLNQHINLEKKEILITFLDMIREKLSLDSESHQFLDKLVLNIKLEKKGPTNKEKKPKI